MINEVAEEPECQTEQGAVTCYEQKGFVLCFIFLIHGLLLTNSAYLYYMQVYFLPIAAYSKH